MQHSEFRPHAFITLSNLGGIEIMTDSSCDNVYYRFNYGQDNLQNEEIFKSPIVHLYAEDSDESNPGFYHGEDESIFYSFNDAMTY